MEEDHQTHAIKANKNVTYRSSSSASAFVVVKPEHLFIVIILWI